MKNIYEIFDEFNTATTKNDRIVILQKNMANNPSFGIILQGAFHPSIRFIFDEPVIYKPSDAPPGMGYMNMPGACDYIYIFVDGSKKVKPELTKERKEIILVQVLESMEAREAEVFMNMILKDLKVKYLTYNLVNEAIPGLLPQA